MNITEITPTATTENKQHICDLLTETLKATRDQHDLVRIRYEEIGPEHQQVVLDYESGGHLIITDTMTMYPFYCPDCQLELLLRDQRTRYTGMGEVVDCPLCGRPLYRSAKKKTWEIVRGSEHAEVGL